MIDTTYFMNRVTTEYKVNEEKRTVVCIMTTVNDVPLRLAKYGLADEDYDGLSRLLSLPQANDLRSTLSSNFSSILSNLRPTDEWEYGTSAGGNASLKQLLMFMNRCPNLIAANFGPEADITLRIPPEALQYLGIKAIRTVYSVTVKDFGYTVIAVQ